MKLVKDYMKKKVKKTRPSYSIFKAAEIMSKYHLSGMPVVRGNKVIGMITEADIIKFMKIDLSKNNAALAAEPHSISIVLLTLLKGEIDLKREIERLSKFKVKDFMTKGVISVAPDVSILEAANTMDKYEIDRLPVIEVGKLVGIVSRSDLIKALLD